MKIVFISEDFKFASGNTFPTNQIKNIKTDVWKSYYEFGFEALSHYYLKGFKNYKALQGAVKNWATKIKQGKSTMAEMPKFETTLTPENIRVIFQHKDELRFCPYKKLTPNKMGKIVNELLKVNE